VTNGSCRGGCELDKRYLPSFVPYAAGLIDASCGCGVALAQKPFVCCDRLLLCVDDSCQLVRSGDWRCGFIFGGAILQVSVCGHDSRSFVAPSVFA
jgi:hypothetical protein